MTLSQIYRVGPTSSVGFFLTVSGAAAQAHSTQGVNNVVFVHGAWADGSSWSNELIEQAAVKAGR